MQSNENIMRQFTNGDVNGFTERETVRKSFNFDQKRREMVHVKGFAYIFFNMSSIAENVTRP